MPGPFELQELLGEGGMGRVWRAIHRGSGLPVAVKSMADRHDLDVRAFAEEVRAVAALDHPRVIRVFDHGVARDGEDLAPGRPWLAMALARGTLNDLTGAPWTLVRHALLHVLDGLAHVHARGVVHRDLKPSNVLLGCALDALREPDHPIDGLVIADFGLASHHGSAALAGGTPGFMAPEQRDVSCAAGPWTDLYAVGAVARHLLAISAVNRVPSEIEGWCAWLAHAEPARRPDSAAEAARALASLPDEVPGEAPRGPTSDALEPTNVVFEPLTTVLWGPRSSPGTPPDDEPILERHGVDSPSVPEDGWIVRRSPWPVPIVRDAGLGLLAYRTPPFTARETERRRLWEALTLTTRERTPRAFVLQGESGIGRRRLARWLATRAHELGTHEVLYGGLDGVEEQWRRHVRCRLGAEPAQLVEVLRDAVSQRPVVLVLDEADASDIECLERALDEVTGSWFAVVARVPTSTTWTHPAVTVQSLGPLSLVDLERLVSDAIYLDHDSARTVAVAASGNPGRALQMLRAWVADGQLVSGPVGFRPTDDLDVIPADGRQRTPHELEADARLEDGDERGAIEALIAAIHEAASGGRRDVEHRAGRRLREVLRDSGVPRTDHLFVRAMSVSIRDLMEGGRQREIAMMRELRQVAHQRGWVDLECRFLLDEAVLTGAMDPGRSDTVERLWDGAALAARHGLTELQVEAQRLAASELMRRLRLHEARTAFLGALDLAAQLHERLRVANVAIIHGELAALCSKLGDDDDTSAHGRAALELLDELNPRDASLVLRSIASALLIAGHTDQAVATCRALIARARDAHHGHREATGWSMLGRTLLKRGQRVEAEEALAESIKLADRYDGSSMQSRMALAQLWVLDGHYRDAWNLVDPERIAERRPHPMSQQHLELLRVAARYGRGALASEIRAPLREVVAMCADRFAACDDLLACIRDIAVHRGAAELAADATTHLDRGQR